MHFVLKIERKKILDFPNDYLKKKFISENKHTNLLIIISKQHRNNDKINKQF